VAFQSDADNLVPDDTNGRPDIFVKNLVNGEIALVSTDRFGEPAGSYGRLAFSPDGTHLAFQSFANLAGDPGAWWKTPETYIKNLDTGWVTAVSRSYDYEDLGSFTPAFSPDGRSLAFASNANQTGDAIYSPLNVYIATLEDAPLEVVTVEAGGAGDAYGTPAFEVYADGVKIGEGEISNPQTNAEYWADPTYETFAFFHHYAPSSVTVKYINDGLTSGGEDKNLFVKSASFGGVTYDPGEDGWFTPDDPAPGREGPRGDLYWNGALQICAEDPGPGENPIVLQIGGAGDGTGAPAFEVYADGKMIGAGVISDPQTNAEYWANPAYETFAFNAGTPPETVTIKYVNDGRTPGGEDLNLFVKSLSVCGVTYDPRVDGWFTPDDPAPGREGARGDLYWNGSLSFGDTEPDPDPDTIVFRIGGAGDATGAPAFEVYADGEKVGAGAIADPQTNAEYWADRAYETFVFEVDAAPETVAIRYLNDGRTPGGEDMNLFVQSATFGGETYDPRDDGWFTPDDPAPGREGPRGDLYWDGVLQIGDNVGPDTLGLEIYANVWGA
jgi:uncharacterized protein (DUF736 family)